MTRWAKQPHFWIIFVFIAVPLLAFPEIIFGNQTLYWSDLSWIHYPRHIFAAEEWLAGRVPLWDPYQHNGLPFLAESQVGALYFLSTLFLTPLTPSLELSLYIVVHYTLAASFTFLLARLLGLGYPSATVAGLAYGCGGFLMAQVPNLNIMTGAVWLPLILYGIIQTTRQRSWLIAMLAGLPLAFQIFTAQPQIVFYTLVTICIYGLYRITADFFFTDDQTTKGNLQHAAHTAALMGVTIASGLLLAAPQLLPTLELQQLSVRSQEKGFEFLTKNSLPPMMWLQLILPSAFGNNVLGFEGGDPFQEDFIYIGFVALILTFFSLAQRRSRDMPFFLWLLLFGALMAMGRITPLYQLVIQYLPGFALFRIPSRWLMVVNLDLAILAGFGMEALRSPSNSPLWEENQPTSLPKGGTEGGLSKKQFWAVLVVNLLLIIGVVLIWIFRSTLQSGSVEWPGFYQKLLAAFLDYGYTINPIYQNRLLTGRLLPLTVPVYLLIANVTASTLIFYLFAFRKIKANLFGVLIITILSIDLVAAGGTTLTPIRPSSWWRELSGGAQYVVDNLKEGRVFPLGMGSEALTVSHLGQYFPSVYRVRSAGGHGSSLMLERTSTYLENVHPAQAIRTLGVRYLLTEGQLGADAAAVYPLVFSDDDSFVYENPAPYPRAFMVHDLIQTDSPEEALSYFETANLDPAQTVVIETFDTLPAPQQPSRASRAAIIQETPQILQIEVDAAADGYLVLLDTYYPGWKAQIDSQPSPIYRANYISRAVFVPAGQHVIEFNYCPLSFYLGLGLAGLTLTVLVSLSLVDTKIVRP